MTGPLPRQERLSRRAEFQAVFQQGKRVERPSLTVLWRPSDAPRKVGFAVSRQVRSAVKRNRARRRMREAYRIGRDTAPTRVAVVIVGRARVIDVEFASLVAEMQDALGAIPGAR